jgi:hypothetical protein
VIDSRMKPEQLKRVTGRFGESNRRALAQYRESDAVKAVEILVAEDGCDACKAAAGKQYDLDDVPVLPNPQCPHKKGCRCTYVAITKSYAELGIEGVEDPDLSGGA